MLMLKKVINVKAMLIASKNGKLINKNKTRNQIKTDKNKKLETKINKKIKNNEEFKIKMKIKKNRIKNSQLKNKITFFLKKELSQLNLTILSIY
jgi:hypothetical protein